MTTNRRPPTRKLGGADLRVDLAIVGGGLAGLTLALASAEAGLNVALIDRLDLNAILDPRFDGRTTALAHGAKQVMAAIGAWDDLSKAAEPILEIRVADGASPLFLHYDHKLIGDDPLGFIIENVTLRRILYERVAQHPAITYVAPAGVAGMVDDGAYAAVSLDTGQVIRAELVAACDGRNSALREAAGIDCLRWRYDQTAIVACVAHEKPHRGVAVEHFRPAGPFAILPMPISAAGANRSSIVWTESAAHAPAFLKLEPKRFQAELQRRFGDFLGTVALAGPVWSYPLSFLHARRYVAPRLALVGDAAHVIHPIAGQGLNLGIRDVAALAESAVDARRLGLDIGNAEFLRRYESRQRLDGVKLAAATDTLNRLFSNGAPPVAALRDLGLGAVNRLPRLKKFFMRQAMGAGANLPKLARGERL